jgi:hypothetical protein
MQEAEYRSQDTGYRIQVAREALTSASCGTVPKSLRMEERG